MSNKRSRARHSNTAHSDTAPATAGQAKEGQVSEQMNDEYLTRRRESIRTIIVGAIVSPILIALGITVSDWQQLIVIGVAVALLTLVYGISGLFKTRRLQQPIPKRQAMAVGTGMGISVLIVIVALGFLVFAAVFMFLFFAAGG